MLIKRLSAKEITALCSNMPKGYVDQYTAGTTGLNTNGKQNEASTQGTTFTVLATLNSRLSQAQPVPFGLQSIVKFLLQVLAENGEQAH